jgi:hypothetical protein
MPLRRYSPGSGKQRPLARMDHANAGTTVHRRAAQVVLSFGGLGTRNSVPADITGKSSIEF